MFSEPIDFADDRKFRAATCKLGDQIQPNQAEVRYG
jgi:hypothetical protein